MNSQRTTIILLILIVIAAMWTSGRMAALINAVLDKDGAGSAASQPGTGSGSAAGQPKTGGGSTGGRTIQKH